MQCTSMILKIVAHSCSFIPEHMVESFELPDMSVISFLEYYPKDIVTLDLVHWHFLVRETFRWTFQESNAQQAFTNNSLETVAYYLLYNDSEYLLDQFCHHFTTILSKQTDLTAVLLGHAPFVNDPLRRLAAVGSSYFDTVYHNMAAIYDLHTASKQHILAPSEALCKIYDLVVKMSRPHSAVQTHVTRPFLGTGPIKVTVWMTNTEACSAEHLLRAASKLLWRASPHDDLAKPPMLKLHPPSSETYQNRRGSRDRTYVTPHLRYGCLVSMSGLSMAARPPAQSGAAYAAPALPRLPCECGNTTQLAPSPSSCNSGSAPPH